MKLAIATLALFAATTVSALSATAHSDWHSSVRDDRCVASTQPDTGGGDAYLSIMNDKSEGVRGTVSAVSGKGADVVGLSAVFDVDGTEFETLVFQGAAFTASGAPEGELVAAMRRGKEIKVTWSLGGETTVHKYSLMGFTAAKNAIDRGCR